MVQIAGTYQQVETVNPEVLMQVLGKELSEETKAALAGTKPRLVIEVDGDNYIFTSTVEDTWRRENKFTLGKTFEEKTPSDEKITTTVAKDGDKLIFKSSSASKSGQRIYEFTDDGVTMHVDVGGAKAKKVFKRV